MLANATPQRKNKRKTWEILSVSKKKAVHLVKKSLKRVFPSKTNETNTCHREKPKSPTQIFQQKFQWTSNIFNKPPQPQEARELSHLEVRWLKGTAERSASPLLGVGGAFGSPGMWFFAGGLLLLKFDITKIGFIFWFRSLLLEITCLFVPKKVLGSGIPDPVVAAMLDGMHIDGDPRHLFLIYTYPTLMHKPTRTSTPAIWENTANPSPLQVTKRNQVSRLKQDKRRWTSISTWMTPRFV